MPKTRQKKFDGRIRMIDSFTTTFAVLSHNKNICIKVQIFFKIKICVNLCAWPKSVDFLKRARPVFLSPKRKIFSLFQLFINCLNIRKTEYGHQLLEIALRNLPIVGFPYTFFYLYCNKLYLTIKRGLGVTFAQAAYLGKYNFPLNLVSDKFRLRNFNYFSTYQKVHLKKTLMHKILQYL